MYLLHLPIVPQTQPIPSAFKGFNTSTSIPLVVPNTFQKVLFSNEQFDLANEYNTSTSTFVAKTAGVYLFTSTIEFIPNDSNVDYELVVGFVINGVLTPVATDVDYTGFNAFYTNVVQINDIFYLNAGDTVEVSLVVQPLVQF